MHAHNYIEISYIYSGSGTHYLGDKKYKVSKGDLFIINYDVAHEFRSSSDITKPRLQVFNCIFKPEFIDSALANSRDFSNLTSHFLFRSLFPEEKEIGSDIKIINKDDHVIGEIYEKIYYEYVHKNDGYIEILRAYVIELLITIFRIYKKQKSGENGIDISRMQIMNKVIQYMKDNYSHNLKLEEISLKAFLSKNYFSKIFKEYTGMTVFEYAQKIRIEEACTLLKNTNKKISDISFNVGYSDIKFFNQIFKRQTGRTPSEYRKSIKR